MMIMDKEKKVQGEKEEKQEVKKEEKTENKQLFLIKRSSKCRLRQDLQLCLL